MSLLLAEAFSVSNVPKRAAFIIGFLTVAFIISTFIAIFRRNLIFSVISVAGALVFGTIFIGVVNDYRQQSVEVSTTQDYITEKTTYQFEAQVEEEPGSDDEEPTKTFDIEILSMTETETGETDTDLTVIADEGETVTQNEEETEGESEAETKKEKVNTLTLTVYGSDKVTVMDNLNKRIAFNDSRVTGSIDFTESDKGVSGSESFVKVKIPLSDSFEVKTDGDGLHFTMTNEDLSVSCNMTGATSATVSRDGTLTVLGTDANGTASTNLVNGETVKNIAFSGKISSFVTISAENGEGTISGIGDGASVTVKTEKQTKTYTFVDGYSYIRFIPDGSGVKAYGSQTGKGRFVNGVVASVD